MAESDKLFSPEFYETHPRVRLQAEEVGPIVNYLASDIYKTASESWQLGTKPVPGLFRDFSEFGADLAAHASQFIPPSSSLQELIGEARWIKSRIYESDHRYRVTYYKSVHEVISEGI